MDAGLLGLFSGFPTHHFTDEIAKVLCDNLPKRQSRVYQCMAGGLRAK